MVCERAVVNIPARAATLAFALRDIAAFNISFAIPEIYQDIDFFYLIVSGGAAVLCIELYAQSAGLTLTQASTIFSF